jgi:hypothetical protein
MANKAINFREKLLTKISVLALMVTGKRRVKIENTRAA